SSIRCATTCGLKTMSAASRIATCPPWRACVGPKGNRDRARQVAGNDAQLVVLLRGNAENTKLEMSHETQCTWPRRNRGSHVCDPCYRASFLRHVRCPKVDDPGRHRQGIPVDQSPQLDPADGGKCRRQGGTMGDRDGRA